MFTDLRRHGWRDVFGAGPIGTMEYVRDVLRVEDWRLDEMAAWDEVPPRLREAIILCCIAEKNTGRPMEAEDVAAVARHHGVSSAPVMLALGWMPPSHYCLTETERTVLRLVAAMDLATRREN